MSERTWITDARGNRCSVEYFGSKEAAQKALDGLIDCARCSDCSDCARCSGCSDCSDCSYCSDCSDCSYCSDCSDCSYCSDCSDCARCSYCSDCARCSGCSDCSDCSDCARCSGCSGCSRCSDCARCSGCSGCSRCSDLENAAPVPMNHVVTRPAIPAIKDIHKAVFEAASQPEALDMKTWHTCATTHCRAGWVVTLAGEEGKKLESFHNTLLAAQLIYRESGYKINPSRFFDSNEDSLADMKRLASVAE